MCNNNNNFNANQKALAENLINKPEIFRLLISDRTTNYRQGLYDKLDTLFPPGKSDKTWKGYYLYPDKIPENGKELYMSAMEKVLVLQLQKMSDELKKRIEIMQSDIQKFTDTNQTIDKIIQEYGGR